MATLLVCESLRMKEAQLMDGCLQSIEIDLLQQPYYSRLIAFDPGGKIQIYGIAKYTAVVPGGQMLTDRR